MIKDFNFIFDISVDVHCTMYINNKNKEQARNVYKSVNYCDTRSVHCCTLSTKKVSFLIMI